MRLEVLDVVPQESEFRRWGGTLSEATVVVVRADGHEVALPVGRDPESSRFGGRQWMGVFLGSESLVQGVAADDFATTNSFISMIKQNDGRTYAKSAAQVPKDLRASGLKITTQKAEIAAPRSKEGLALKLRANDWNGWMLHALVRARQKGLSYASLARRRWPSRGQGYLRDAEVRMAIEEHAMRLALSYYRDQWRSVTDVSAHRRGFDIECRDGSEVLHVEVKGTQGDVPQALFTANEVEHTDTCAREHEVFFVLGIRLDDEGEEFTCKGGDPWTYSSFQFDRHRLKATQYLYRLD